MASYGSLGRGVNAGPATDLFPLSGATASSPSIAITATTATGGGTTVHTADLNAQDVLFVTVANNAATALTAYALLGTTATTSVVPLQLNSNTNQILFAGNAAISKSGVLGIFTTATTGLVAYGYVARTYTATG